MSNNFISPAHGLWEIKGGTWLGRDTLQIKGGATGAFTKPGYTAITPDTPDGYIRIGAATTDYRCVGFTDSVSDNTSGSDGDKSILIYLPSGGATIRIPMHTDTITIADLGKTVYADGPDTFTLSSGTRAPAVGQITEMGGANGAVDAGWVWIDTTILGVR